ncbi:MAG: cysteine peptidase family C39 domain-containing protein [Planctomycetota bacterium]
MSCIERTMMMGNFTSREPRVSRGTILPFALLAVLLLVAGCRTTTTTIPPGELSDSAVRLDLPLVRQDALYDCGLASISALCQYWGIEIPAEQRLELARKASDEAGLSGGELQHALQGLGLEVYVFQGQLDRTSLGLYAHVDAGRPLLVMLSPDGRSNHYELLLGYDEPLGNLILIDPMQGEILVHRDVFVRNWAQCRQFTLLACPLVPGARHDLPGELLTKN